MKNTTELREELSKVFQDLKDRKINVEEARAFTSIGNSMVKSAIAEANHNIYLEDSTPIKFLETQSEKSK